MAMLPKADVVWGKSTEVGIERSVRWPEALPWPGLSAGFPASSYRSTRERGRYSSQRSAAHRGDFEQARLAEGRNL